MASGHRAGASRERVSRAGPNRSDADEAEPRNRMEWDGLHARFRTCRNRASQECSV